MRNFNIKEIHSLIWDSFLFIMMYELKIRVWISAINKTAKDLTKDESIDVLKTLANVCYSAGIVFIKSVE